MRVKSSPKFFNLMSFNTNIEGRFLLLCDMFSVVDECKVSVDISASIFTVEVYACR